MDNKKLREKVEERKYLEYLKEIEIKRQASFFVEYFIQKIKSRNDKDEQEK